MARFFSLSPLLLVALLLSGCVTTGGGNLFSLWRKGTPSVVASGGATPAEEEEEEEEGEDPLDAWLQALTYRSPDYGLQPPERKNTLKEALQTAFALQGTPYRFGGTSENGLDCSGLVWVSFASAGIKLPRSSQEQFFATERIGRNDLRPGDLVFFKTGRTKKRAVDHVGIYIGNNQFLHAPRRGKPVSVASLDEQYWRQRYIGAGRVPLDKADRSDLTLALLPPDAPPQPTLSHTTTTAENKIAAKAAAPTGSGARSSASASRHEAKRSAQNQKSPPPTKVASHNPPQTAKSPQQKRETTARRQDRTPRQVAAQQPTKAKPPSSAQAAQSPSPAKSTAQPANRSRSPTPSASVTASGKAPAKKETAKRDNAVAIR
jgi:cell wall-associated NlpC family hydrolase